MMKFTKILRGLSIFIIITVIALALYLNRGLSYEIVPAKFNCLALEDGYFAPFDSLPNQIYGIGLSYAGHINETASEFVPDIDPPVFKKAITSITQDGAKVKLPSHDDLVNAVEKIEPSIRQQINEVINPLPALLDYEVELGFVLLEDIDKKALNEEGYIPKIGFFIANDLSARSIVILGEGQINRYDYWGIAKSFPGFTPVSQKVWIPNEFKANAIPCITLKCQLNGEIRQNQMTNDLIYTPLQMLQVIHRKYPDTPLKKGDWVLTGTPGGVIMSTPRWLVRLANMVGMNRFKKLNHKTREDDIAKFLKRGDTVVIDGEGLGSVTVEFVWK
mgnify:CR=1 FL=1